MSFVDGMKTEEKEDYIIQEKEEMIHGIITTFGAEYYLEFKKVKYIATLNRLIDFLMLFTEFYDPEEFEKTERKIIKYKKKITKIENEILEKKVLKAALVNGSREIGLDSEEVAQIKHAIKLKK
ncbi:hypothetical protein C173_03264 [Paenibacillus sp. FSL R7-277]|uniref:hypothetical protein n=1 Tax=Paenibacillus sp. FSL R7-277 TaxID=1227352 RepID=UPI0003E1F86D|nr:hypothetical protein [Paenibacillus sp. FSL R7-277]ETT77502.1 hypothetical protein C173_03264 [Paenibacillus sp. FSL R7-277]